MDENDLAEAAAVFLRDGHECLDRVLREQAERDDAKRLAALRESGQIVDVTNDVTIDPAQRSARNEPAAIQAGMIFCCRSSKT